MGVLLCVLAFVGTYAAARRSVGHGFGALLAVGYLYGALRARFLDGFSHFIFDLSTAALYIACFTRRAPEPARSESRWLGQWLWLLIGWPVLWFFVPLQHPLIQLVGLRSAIFFLLIVLVGARLEKSDIGVIARCFAVLNLVALAVGLAEYVWGIEWLFPLNPVTEILYMSADVVSGGDVFLRIPATFPNAHAYGNTMLASMPFLLGRLGAGDTGRRERWLIVAALGAAGVGIFLCGARQVVIQLALLMTIFLLASRPTARTFAGVFAVALLVGVMVANNERLQRFLTLSDTELVFERLHISANVTTFELLLKYPIGAGLGSAFGTTIPFFLAPLAPQQIGAENEYSRMALEQSPMGVAILLLFLGALLLRRPRISAGGSQAFAMTVWAYVAIAWGTAFIGTGITTSIPSTALLYLMMGMLARRKLVSQAAPAGSELSPMPVSTPRAELVAANANLRQRA